MDEIKDEFLELILNELDLIHADSDMRKKITRMIESGKAYLDDKFAAPINYDTDKQALLNIPLSNSMSHIVLLSSAKGQHQSNKLVFIFC